MKILIDKDNRNYIICDKCGEKAYMIVCTLCGDHAHCEKCFSRCTIVTKEFEKRFNKPDGKEKHETCIK